MWVRSTISLNAGDLSFGTSESANLATSQDVTLPALTANTWTRVRLDTSGIALTSKDTIISLGLKVVNSKAAIFSVYVDDVRWAYFDGILYNGTFTGNATGWTLGTGWAYSSNNVLHSAGNTADLSQILTPVVWKCPYRVTFTIAGRSAGSVTASVGGGTASTLADVNGTYERIVTCGTTNYTVAITPTTDFDGTIDDVICTPLIPRCDVDTLPTTYGGGVRILYVMDNALSNGANSSITDIRYTNQAASDTISGNARGLGAVINHMASDVVAHLPHSGVGAGKFGPFLPLAAGDYGVQKVDSCQFPTAQATALAACDILVCKQLASIPLTTAFVAAERDLMNQLPSLPRIRDGACLMFLHHAGAVTASGTAFMGYLDFAWS